MFSKLGLGLGFPLLRTYYHSIILSFFSLRSGIGISSLLVSMHFFVWWLCSFSLIYQLGCAHSCLSLLCLVI